jgi:hypothetical protein
MSWSICNPTVLAGPTPQPWRNRVTIYPAYVGAKALPIVAAKAKVQPRMQTIRRPYMSANGVQKSGDMANANAGMATV